MRGAPNIKKQPENSIVKACICWLYRHGCDVIRNNTGTAIRKYVRQSDGAELTYRIRYGKKGSGDIIACSPYGRWIEVAPPGSPTTIALVPAGVPGGIRLATGDAGADHAELRSRGVDVDPEVLQLPGAPPMFGLRDPDGNSLILVEWT